MKRTVLINLIITMQYFRLIKLYIHTIHFEGCEANSIFGSVIIDLRDAIITEDTVINCYCVFAGIDIYVPANVNIRISGTPIFGGITNKTGDYENINAPTIFINATTMFGGVTIK